MELGNYWSTRLSRRRVLSGASAIGVGAASLALIGCGGGSDGQQEDIGNLTPREDTSEQAVRGGIFQTNSLTNPSSFDPIAGNSSSGAAAAWVYNQLLTFEEGKLKRPAGAVIGDFAESFELSSDGLQLTLKVRRDAKWDQRAPTSSRAVDAEDVVWSWNRYETLASGRTNLANSASPEAPVLSASAPDTKTVVFKLAFPRAEILDLFAGPGPRIMPREFEDRNKADVRNTMLGSGAWMMTAAESGVRLQYRRNPNWWRKDRPFLDGFDVFISPETSTNIAQFRAQNFWWGNATIPQEQILDTKRDFPELQMIGGSEYSTGSKHVKFGWRPNSPFQDVRVRRAVSMAIDRDLYAETLSHIAQFEAAGFPRELRWASHIGPGWEGIWLDPRANGGKALGEGGKYFQYNAAEARKLLSAAGHANGLTVDSSFNARGYGATYFDELEIVSGMLEEVGFKVNRKPREYETEWLPNYFYSRGDFDGLSWGPGAGRAGVGIFIQNFYHSAGVGNIPEGVDPKLDDMIRKQAEELDRETRIGQIQEIQKYMAVEMKVVPHDYSIPPFELAWPWVKNFGTFVGWPGGTNATQQIYIHNWIDKSLLPGRFQTS